MGGWYPLNTARQAGQWHPRSTPAPPDAVINRVEKDPPEISAGRAREAFAECERRRITSSDGGSGRIRRFLRPSFRRPRPVFFVPKTHAPCAIYRDRFPPIGNRTVYPEPGRIGKPAYDGLLSPSGCWVAGVATPAKASSNPMLLGAAETPTPATLFYLDGLKAHRTN